MTGVLGTVIVVVGAVACLLTGLGLFMVGEYICKRLRARQRRVT